MVRADYTLTNERTDFRLHCMHSMRMWSFVTDRVDLTSVKLPVCAVISCVHVCVSAHLWS